MGNTSAASGMARLLLHTRLCVGIIVAVIAMSISTGQAVNLQEDVEQASLDADAKGKWVYVPKASAKKQDKKAKKAAKVLSAAKKGRWVKGKPGMTASQIAKKQALLKAKILNGARAARKAARKKARLKREVERSQKRVKLTKKREKEVTKSKKKAQAEEFEAKKEAAQDQPMKDMSAFMKAEAASKGQADRLKKSAAKLKKVLKQEEKAKKRRKKKLRKEKKIVLKKKVIADMRKAKVYVQKAKTGSVKFKKVDKKIQKKFGKKLKNADKKRKIEDKAQAKESRTAQIVATDKGRVKELKIKGDAKELSIKKKKDEVVVDKARKESAKAEAKETKGKNKYNAIRKAAADAPNLKRRAVRKLQKDMTVAQNKKRAAEKDLKAKDKAHVKAKSAVSLDKVQLAKAKGEMRTAKTDLAAEKEKASKEGKFKKKYGKDKVQLNLSERKAKVAERRRKAQIHVAREVQGKQKAAAYSIDEAYAKKKAAFSSKEQEGANKKIKIDKMGNEKAMKDVKKAKKDYKLYGVKEGHKRKIVKVTGQTLQIDAVRAAHKADIPSPTKALEKANKLRVKWSRKKVGDRNKLKLTTAALKKSRASKKRVDAGVRADQTAAVKTVKLARSKAEQDVIKGRSAKKVKKVTTNTNE